MSDSCNSAMCLQESNGAAFDFQSIVFAFLYVLRTVFSYTYGTVIKEFNYAQFVLIFTICMCSSGKALLYLDAHMLILIMPKNYMLGW